MATIADLLTADPTLLDDAKLSQLLIVSPPGSPDLAVHADGVDASAGGLRWAVSPAGASYAAFRAKYAMMTAMLKDGARNEEFEAAIGRAVARVAVSAGRAAPLALDVGTGTGFLAICAAKAGARVVACEMNAAVAAVAVEVVQASGLGGAIAVVCKRSDALTVGSNDDDDADGHDLPRAAEIIVSETLDSELLREGWLPSLRAARADGQLAPGAAVVPALAEVLATVVAVDAVKGGALRALGSTLVLLQPVNEGEEGAGGMLLPVAGAALDVDGLPPLMVQAEALLERGVLRPLTAAVPVMEFDFRDEELPERRERSVAVTTVEAAAAGETLALLLRWRAKCDEQSARWVGTAADCEWQDHWHSSLSAAGALAGGGGALAAGEQLELQMLHNDFELVVRVARAPAPETKDEGQAVRKRPKPSGLDAVRMDGRSALPRRQLWAMADRRRAAQYAQAIRAALALHSSSGGDGKGGAAPLCLDVSDGAWCAMAAAELGAASLSLTHGSGELARRFWLRLVAKRAKLDAQKQPLFLSPTLSCATLTPDADELQGKRVSVVMSECDDASFEGRAVWSALSFFAQVRALRSSGVLAQGAATVPQTAAVWAVAADFGRLRGARGPLGASVCGVDHAAADARWADCVTDSAGASGSAFPDGHTWNYEIRPVSAPFKLLELDFQAGSLVSSGAQGVELEFGAGPTHVDGIVIFVEQQLGQAPPTDGADEAEPPVFAPEIVGWERRELVFLPERSFAGGDGTTGHAASMVMDVRPRRVEREDGRLLLEVDLAVRHI